MREPRGGAVHRAAGGPAPEHGGFRQASSGQKTYPRPWIPAARLLSSCVFLCFLEPGEILKSGVGIAFSVYIYICIYMLLINL